MNGSVAWELNSLILTGRTLRTFSVAVSDCCLPLVGFRQEALATRSPLKATGPALTLKVALTLAPGATGSANVFEVSAVPETTELHCLLGTAMRKVTPARAAAVVFEKVTVVFC